MDVEREQNNTHGGNENKGKENATVSVPLWVERMTQWSVGEAYPSNASMSNEETVLKLNLANLAKLCQQLNSRAVVALFQSRHFCSDVC